MSTNLRDQSRHPVRLGDPRAEVEQGRRLDIQGLRAVAVLLVIASHAGTGLTGGFVGVDIFFVISGYVITLVLVRDIASHGRPRLGRFYIRRAYRLIPALALVGIVTAVAGMFLLSPLGTQQQSAVTGGAASIGASNIALYFISSDYFSEHVQTNPFLHTWSLGVEEQFYLFFPVIVLGVWLLSSTRSMRPLAAVGNSLIMIAIVSFTLSLVTSYGVVLPGISSPTSFAFYMMPARAWEFAAGAVLACASVWLGRHGSGHAFATWAGLALVAFSTFYIDSSMYFPGVVALLPVAGTALIIYGGLKANPGSQALGSKPMKHLGDISYSLYLWHWPLLVFARRLWPDNPWAIAAAVILAFVLAELTFKYVESPLRGRASAFNMKTLRIPAVAVIASGAACAILLAGAQLNWFNDNVSTSAKQLLARPVGYASCLSTVPVSKRDLGPCTWGAERSGDPIYLVGDSNAQQFTEALIGAAEATSRPLIVATWGGCPFFDSGRVDLADPTKGAECKSYAEDGTGWIASQKTGTVIMASASTLVDDPDIQLQSSTGKLLSDPSEKTVRWGDGMSRQILGLEELGHEVIPVRTIPHFPGETREWWHPTECQNNDLFTDPSRCSASLSGEEVAANQRYIRAAESRGLELSQATAIDLTPEICKDDTCATYRDGRWLYRDGLHISPEYSQHLAGIFTARLS